MAEHHADHAHSQAAHDHGHGDLSGTYWIVFWALMVLLVITLGAAAIPLGPLNLPIALTIAVAKMVIIVQYFMHLKFSTKLVRLFGTCAGIWLSILFILTLSDYASRPWFHFTP